MSLQIPRGWNRWRFWMVGGVDDYGFSYRSFRFRLRPRGRVFRVDIGMEDA